MASRLVGSNLFLLASALFYVLKGKSLGNLQHFGCAHRVAMSYTLNIILLAILACQCQGEAPDETSERDSSKCG